MLLPQANPTFTDIYAFKINKSHAQMQLSLYYFQTSNSEVAMCKRWQNKVNGDGGKKNMHLRNILLFEVTLRPPPVSQKTGKKARTRSLQ